MPTEEITQTQAGSELRTVPLSSLNVVEGFNPREHFDPVALEQLTASVRQVGILQPLNVEPHPDIAGEFNIVDGHRRYLAAGEVGLVEVDVAVRASNNGDALDIAMITALQRADLNVIEEANGFQRELAHGGTQAQLAERLSIPAKRISQGLRLLKLPEAVQAHIASGQLAPSTSKLLLDIAKVSSPVAEAVADYVVAEGLELSVLAERPSDVVSKAVSVTERDVTCVRVGETVSLSVLKLSDELVDRIKGLFDGELPTISFRREDADAAEAYGCLLSFQGDESWHVSRFICNAELLADRVALQLDAFERDLEEQRKAEQAAEAEDTAKGDQGDPDDPGAAAAEEVRVKAERAAERARLEQAKKEARAWNLALGRKAAEKFHEPELTKADAEMIALQIFGSTDTAQLAIRGLSLTQEDWQEEERKEIKSTGKTKTKVTYITDAAGAEEALWKWFKRARTPKQMIGRVMQALVAAHFADNVVLPQSKRSPWTVAAGYHPDDPTSRLPELMAKVAKRVLPPPVNPEQ